MIARTKAPSLLGDLTFRLPAIQNNALDSGINLYSVEKKDLPIIQLNFMFKAGSKFEIPGLHGTAELLSLLIDEGAGEYDSLSLSNEFEKLGIITAFGTDLDRTYISLLTLEKHIDRALELIGGIIKEPWLKEEEFEREKFKQSTKILQSAAQPSYLADILFKKAVFHKSQYQHPVMGYNHSLKKISLEDTKSFYQCHFAPKNADIIAVGNFRTNELVNKLNNVFSGWIKDQFDTDINFAPEPYKRKLMIIDKPESAQTEIRIGHIAGKKNSPDYLAKVVANSILGGQFTSRLNSNLREDKGYTYGIRSSFYYNENGGLFEISTSVDTKNTVKAVVEIMKEFRGIKDGIKLEEIEFTKSYLIRRFPSLFETYSQISKNIGNLVIHKLDEN